jgi:hypothetical protein
MIQPLASLLAFPVTGFLSVLLYRRRSIANNPVPRMGFRLGALTGLFGFGLLMVLAAAEMLTRHTETDMHAAMIKMIQQAQARNPDPRAKQVFDYFMSAQGMAVFMMLSFVLGCIIFVLLSGIGGAISASLLRRKAPPRE